MPEFSDAQVIELFHLAFLQVLQARLDQARYVLKGGTNLRYFFDSVRYSEDIDLDIDGLAPWTLTEKVDGILASPTIDAVLRSGGLAVEHFTKPKQTETTRRWKIAIAVSGRSETVRTKIELSHRNGERRHVLEPVPSPIVAPYALRAPTVQHYTADAATEQKIKALAGRSETQARDVFDLDLLLRRQPLQAGTIDPQILMHAAERGLDLPFEAFLDQVLPFLDPEVTELYDSKATWEEMQLFVTDTLLAAR
ncbi:MAG TPA: nucleotidyl transferase AbiEii/AbiGii toxin family protein [Solirubrobacteraceae bacterium]|nr:nucleotidyl transferase AbiEii/AbiGii toxin family protein [Solirubrobacteraceae bacterium]